MYKKDIRKALLTNRKNRSAEEQSLLEEQLLWQLKQIQLPDEIQYIMSYQPITRMKEINIAIIEKYLLQKYPSVQFCYPTINGDDMQIFINNNQAKWSINEWNINEITEGTLMNIQQIDIILLPLIAFDIHGNRIGYGKGYYDQFIIKNQIDCLKIGLSIEDAVEYIADVNPWDQKLDIGVTPKKVYYFN